MRNQMTGAEFISYMYQENCWSNGPEPMTIEDAAYNIREYKAEGLPIPVTVTPKLYCRLWNMLYTRDTGKEVV